MGGERKGHRGVDGERSWGRLDLWGGVGKLLHAGGGGGGWREEARGHLA